MEKGIKHKPPGLYARWESVNGWYAIRICPGCQRRSAYDDGQSVCGHCGVVCFNWHTSARWVKKWFKKGCWVIRSEMHARLPYS